MAEHTSIVDPSRKTFVIGAIVSGRHPPTFLGGIPDDRKLKQFPGRRAVQVIAFVFARADRELNFKLEAVDLAPSIVQLIASLEKPAIMARHHEVLVGRLVVEAVPVRPVLERRGRSDGFKRTRHADVTIGLECGLVTLTAGDIPDVFILRRVLRKQNGGRGEEYRNESRFHQLCIKPDRYAARPAKAGAYICTFRL